MKVLVAMSGGVDSSVAAAMMVEAGHDVIGVTLKLWEGPGGAMPTAGCCTVSDSEDARRVAAQLDIPYYVLNYTDRFKTAVVDRFLDDYLHGRTPNPCIECNRTVKFDHLLDQAGEFNCDLVVTGHYAQNTYRDGFWRLSRGVDADKDQSYVLAMLGQRELEQVQFPVGVQTKAETREIAAGLGLRTAAKPDSQDICFVGDGDYRDFVRKHSAEAERPGVLVDTAGKVVGEHEGIINFTVGQRKGLGVTFGEPRYVVEVKPESSTVVIGQRSDLAVRSIVLDQVTWVTGDPPDRPAVTVQYRAHGEANPAVFAMEDDQVLVHFDRTQYGIATGQTAALYDGDEVVGSGIIVA